MALMDEDLDVEWLRVQCKKSAMALIEANEDDFIDEVCVGIALGLSVNNARIKAFNSVIKTRIVERGGVEVTHKEMIEDIQADINCMMESIRLDFASIAMYQHHIRLAKSAIEWHKKQSDIDGILELCRSGK